jgi:RsiW-degrading membrane proteinase PrsW (M82 family)
MAFKGLRQRRVEAPGPGWVFSPPPGWPVPPPGWQPPPRWQPDPSWPPAPSGWVFWKPAPEGGPRGDSFSGPASDIRVSCDGQPYAFQPAQPVRIGRATDNDVVVGHPSVSRKHAQLSWADDGWVFENVGQAPTFRGGQSVTRVAVSQPVELTLGSAHGPVLRIEPSPAPAPAPTRAAEVPPRAGGPKPGPGSPGSPAAPAGDELVEAFRILIPVRSWLTNPGWRQGLRLLVITYALLPLVFIALFASSGNLSTPGWAYGLYIAPIWAIGFWLLIRPGPVRALEVQVGIGIIVWTLVWLNVVTININDHLGRVNHAFTFSAALGVGFNEEITKALPVLLAGLILLRFRSVKLDVRMWMFLGTIAGLTFGVSEAALYASREIVIINQAQAASQAVGAVLSFAERVFVDGFQHAVWAGISGFFIGMAVNYRRRRVPLIILGVSIPAVLHALNDWSAGAFNSYWVWILIQAVSLFLFLGYTMSAGSIERQVRQTPMFRGESLIMEAYSESKEA